MTAKKTNIVYKKNFLENQAWSQNNLVCGVDEVGRGCLSGPLVTSAVILPKQKDHRLLKDSKTLSQKELLEAYNWITKHCQYSIGLSSNQEIDKLNIWQSTLIAMKRAVITLIVTSSVKPSAILVDAMPLKLQDTAYKQIPVYHFTKGESKSTSIAAASIIAKVYRDRLMRKLDTIFPGYHLKDHKGY